MEHPLSDMMTNTMSKIKDMIDVNTVVGSPITTPGGVTISPRPWTGSSSSCRTCWTRQSIFSREASCKRGKGIE